MGGVFHRKDEVDLSLARKMERATRKKVILRMAREEPGGFKGGLSAENYLAITGTSRATATRDLQDLVEMGALVRTGRLKGTRYRLAI